MSEMTTNFYPKGGQCSACSKRLHDCSALPFEQMPIHRRDGCDAVVICSDFERTTSPSSATPFPADVEDVTAWLVVAKYPRKETRRAVFLYEQNADDQGAEWCCDDGVVTITPLTSAALSAPPVAGVPEGFVDVMAAVFRELEHRHGDERGNAPRHSHTIPGVWDEDNGELAGKPCAWCALWNKGKEMIKAASTPTPTASEQQQPISDEEAVRILLSGGTLVFRVPHPVKGEGV